MRYLYLFAYFALSVQQVAGMEKPKEEESFTNILQQLTRGRFVYYPDAAQRYKDALKLAKDQLNKSQSPHATIQWDIFIVRYNNENDEWEYHYEPLLERRIEHESYSRFAMRICLETLGFGVLPITDLGTLDLTLLDGQSQFIHIILAIAEPAPGVNNTRWTPFDISDQSPQVSHLEADLPLLSVITRARFAVALHGQIITQLLTDEEARKNYRQSIQEGNDYLETAALSRSIHELHAYDQSQSIGIYLADSLWATIQLLEGPARLAAAGRLLEHIEQLTTPQQVQESHEDSQIHQDIARTRNANLEEEIARRRAAEFYRSAGMPQFSDPTIAAHLNALNNTYDQDPQRQVHMNNPSSQPRIINGAKEC